MKPFLVYTALRFLLFGVTYAVLAGVWVLAFGSSGVLLVPFLLAVVISMVLSVRLLAGPRQRFAAVVQERAERATQRYEQMKAKEDVD